MTGRLVAAAARAWTSDLSLSALALLAFVLSFVLEPLVDDFPRLAWMRVLAEALFAVIVVTAITAVTRRASLGLVTLLFALVMFAVRAASGVDPRLGTLDKILTVVPVLVLMLIVMALSLRAGAVTYHRIAGAVLTYLLIAAVWARVYALIVHVAPRAIAAAATGAGVVAGHDLMYFSIMTLTTAGYGDLLPIHPAARALASLEAIVGVLFPVVYVSRFVSALDLRARG